MALAALKNRKKREWKFCTLGLLERARSIDDRPTPKQLTLIAEAEAAEQLDGQIILSPLLLQRQDTNSSSEVENIRLEQQPWRQPAKRSD